MGIDYCKNKNYVYLQWNKMVPVLCPDHTLFQLPSFYGIFVVVVVKEIPPNHNENLIDLSFGDIHNQIFDEMPHNGSK